MLPPYTKEPREIVEGVNIFTESDDYAEDFGFQWNKFRTTLHDSHSGLPITEERLFRAFGTDLTELKDKTILDVGCGSGRFTEIFLKYGALVDSVDLSSAVFATRDNCPSGDNHRITKANFFDNPFQPDAYDYVTCFGVVQHTPDTARCIELLFRHVKKNGGQVIFDHYRRDWLRGPATNFPLLMTRAYILSLPQERRYPTVEKIYRFFFPIVKFFSFSAVLSKILRKVFPILTHYGSLKLDSHERYYEWGLLDTHDALTDHYKRLFSEQEIADIIETQGCAEFVTFKGDNGVVARCSA